MVRAAVTALLLLMAVPVLAQEGASPPAVSTEAPVLEARDPDSEALPDLPGASSDLLVATPADDAQVPEGALAASGTAEAAPAVETDLASLVLKAHPVVQGVMATLALAVVAVLTIFLFKIAEFAMAFARLRRARTRIAAGEGLIALPGTCPLSLTSQAVRDEAVQLPPGLTADLRASARDRLELRLDRIEAGVVRQLRSGSGLLASIGSVGPFVGLFGTVFGIMNSFLAIAETKTTNLSVVAPGIAEALLATGIGLVAAIPAVLLYNAVVRRIAAYRHALADARAELLLRFSRELDARMTGA